MLAIIPARGGSKGLPGKNIKLLAGKPLIAYTIEAALKANHITEVIVSTEDPKIADIAQECGASIPFMRPIELANDTALSVDAYIYTLDKLEQDFSKIHNEFVVLQPTSPLRKSEDIDQAIEMFYNKDADSIISYTEEQHSIFWHKYLEEDGRLSPIFKDEKLGNRQELKKTYYPNGAIYVFKSSLIKSKKYYTDKTFAYIMDRQNSIDIDTIEDFDHAEYLMSND